MKILVIIPAYNEEKNIVNTIKELDEYFPEIDRVVINDASKDNTKEILREMNINYIDLPLNLGIGGGVQTGYMYALENDYDIAIQMDGDGQHPAKELGKLIEEFADGETDIVVGSRFITNEGFQTSAMRRIGIKLLSMIIRILTGYKVLDVTSGFRAVNKKFIKVYAYDYAQDYPEPEAIVTASKYGAKLKEVPVLMKEREFGKSSISSLHSVYYMIKVSFALLVRSLQSKGV